MTGHRGANITSHSTLRASHVGGRDEGCDSRGWDDDVGMLGIAWTASVGAVMARTNHMSQWYGQTRRCDTLEHAIDFAERDLERTSHISIWPMRNEWMVITWTSVLVN